ncbi:MAG: alkyl sulfatase C-terminal domain-containing protein [Acidimicrobiia bacterium]
MAETRRRRRDRRRATTAGCAAPCACSTSHLNHRTRATPAPGSTVFTLERSALIALVTGTVDLTPAIADGSVTVDGDPTDLQRLVGLLAPVDPDFAVVTP